MRYAILLILLSFSLSVEGQTLVVKSKGESELLSYVTISSEEPERITMTGPDGTADISAFSGSKEILFSVIGYKSRTLSYDQLQRMGFEIFLTPAAVILDQVVVSATKWRQSSQSTPARVTSLSKREMALQNPQTAADLLGSTGEVFIQKSQQGGGSPMIRGFATNRLLIAVDGVRMNNAIFRSGNLQNVISLDPFATERTEVLFGPGSVIYGSDAIGGVMSFYTLNPELSYSDATLIRGNAATRFSSANDEFTGHFDINIGGANWASLSSFSYNGYGDLRMGRHGPEDYLRKELVQRIDGIDRLVANDDPLIQASSAYGQMNLMQKFRFSPDNRWNFNFAFHYSETTDYDRYDRLLRYRDGLPRSAEWRYGPQVWMMNHLQVDHGGGYLLFNELRLSLAHQLFEESRIDRDFNQAERRIREEKVNAWSLNMDLLKVISPSHQLFYGIEGVWNEVDSRGRSEDVLTGVSGPGPSRYPDANWRSMAAYFTWRYDLNHLFTLQAGARYNRFGLNAAFDRTFFPFPFTDAELRKSALTGSLGASINPNEKWAFRVNLSSGFRSPNVDDVGKVFDSEPGSVVVPNPDLKPEYAYNAEIGIARILGSFLKVDVSAYATFLDHALVRRPFLFNGQDSILYDGELSLVQAIQNAAEARVWGIQLGMEAKLAPALSLYLQANYQKGEEELDDESTSPLRHAAPPYGRIDLRYSSGPLRLSLNALYNGEISFENLPLGERSKDFIYAADANGKPYSPAWYSLNFKADYQLSVIPEPKWFGKIRAQLLLFAARRKT
jgi:hemoglobin/transferrin/lactoferrin receptor protein